MLSPFLQDREVILPDERQLVPDTLAVPYRWVCSLDVRHSDQPLARGSGVLIGPRQVLTAAHNLYRPDGSSPSSVYVAPARNGRSNPFGRTKAVAFSVTGPFLTGSRTGSRFDFAVVTLERDVSTLTHTALGGRPLGHWGHPTNGHGTAVRPLASTFLSGKRVVVCGYPGDWCGRARLDPDRGCSEDDQATVPLVHNGSASFPAGLPGTMLHTADTHKGQSGSPVWIKFSNGSRYLVGVHVDAHRVIDAATGRQRPVTANRAVHLTPEVLQVVRQWSP
jgi:V8-like Glu-specific endopeptidase